MKTLSVSESTLLAVFCIKTLKYELLITTYQGRRVVLSIEIVAPPKSLKEKKPVLAV